ncbi:hypothetical protein MTO96_043811 [Rhipicephalus appendiculatus]
MSVHYKFKSSLDFDTVTFDGLHISVGELKKNILQQKKIGKGADFDLQITNAQTKEVYTSDDYLIPKNTSVIVARVPVTTTGRKNCRERNRDGEHSVPDVCNPLWGKKCTCKNPYSYSSSTTTTLRQIGAFCAAPIVVCLALRVMMMMSSPLSHRGHFARRGKSAPADLSTAAPSPGRWSRSALYVRPPFAREARLACF